MKYVVSDNEGNILRTVMVTTIEHSLHQLGTDGVNLHKLPDETGLIDDSKLKIIGNALTPIDDNFNVQHAYIELEKIK